MRCVDYTRRRLAILVNAFELCPLRSRFSTESTTMGLLAKISGLIEPLREFIKTKSVWGTCAGAILLSQAVSNPKKGGQELLGGVSVKMTRNGWGSQVRRLSTLRLSACSTPDSLLIGRVFRSPAAS